MTSVLLISSSYRPDIGGVETHIQDLIFFLNRRGHNVVLLTFQPYQLDVAKVQRIEREGDAVILRLPRPCRSIFFCHNRWNPLYQIIYLPFLLLFGIGFILAHRKEVNVVHAHGVLSTPIAVFITKIFKKGCIMSLHHTFILNRNFHKVIARILFSLPDKVLCLSNRSRLELLKIGLRRERVQTFTYWINQTKFRPLDKKYCKKSLNLQNKFVILFVGRLIEEKGVRILLKVARRLTNIFGDMVFVFIGVGPLAKDIIASSKNSRNLIFQGVVKNEDLPVWYNAADVVVVPSVSEEGFGRVILESLACGTPVIAANRGGIPEALDSSVGVLIEPTAEAMANSIVTLYNRRDELIRLTNNCHVYAQKRFSEDNGKLIEEAYTESLK